MEDKIGEIISEIASTYLSKFSLESVSRLFDHLLIRKPEFRETLLNAKTSQDVESIFHEAIGILNVTAESGSITIDNALLSAIRSASFNHAQGTITIAGSTIYAPRLVTGGGYGATGSTTISGTNLKSRGTEIRMGKNASIKYSGNARIEQN